ncbi:hypothetical protein BSK48_30575 [Paenibacillus odorifer]|nr:hypothetical protein BSK48_30575 [Paenibacillus odorifer]
MVFQLLHIHMRAKLILTSSYDINAFTKFLLSTGYAEITIIEVDDNDNTITESSRSLNDG